MTRHSHLSRRKFLQMSARGTAALTGSTALGLGPLSVLNAAPSAALDGADDYRALVCVFLFGGADTANLIVPRSTDAYATYAASRQTLAEAKESLLPITPATPQSAEFGLNSQVPELAQRFAEGSLAFVANTGPLVEPLNKQEYLDKLVERPPHLFSHKDQQEQRQLAEADAEHGRGWCGRVADHLSHLNGDTPLSMNISLAGPVPMLVGETASPYSMGVGGSVPLVGMEPGKRRRKVFDILLQSRGNALEDGYSRTQEEAMFIDALISDALASAPTFDGLFPTGLSAAAQLQMIARMIAIREELGAKRQIFFVSMEGFDTHSQQQIQLPGLFRDLSLALDGFQNALESIGADSCVTTFTTSEFGRTLSTNGSGSDHGWGNHAIVMGSNVLGGEIYGTMPDLTLDGPDDLGGGRVIPTLSEDQYAATLARWIGLDPLEVAGVFPNLANFAQQDLGFLG